jgi:hypothetical protein
MSLSVNVMTRGPGARVAAMLWLLRPVADEILVALDDRADAEVEAALGPVADTIIRYPYSEPVDRPLAWIHSQCRGEWVLTIDDDEIPARGLLDALPELTRARDVTHYWLPRRWLYPAADRYLDARPWRPDYQCRLVLNDPRLVSFPDETHVPIFSIGPRRYLELPVYHADCVLNSREAREAKARRYERLHPGKRVAGRPLNEAYYLPELVDPPTREVPAEDYELIAAVLGAERLPREAVAEEVRAAGRAEIDRHWAGRKLAEGAYAAQLTLLENLTTLHLGDYTTVDVRVENLGDDTWPHGLSGGPLIAVGGRWLRDGSVEEGLHTPLPADLPPGGSQIVPAAIVAPPEPGRYTLELDLVHEHARWFDCAVRTEVEIKAPRVVAVLDPGSLDGLVAALETLDPEEVPVVITHARDELARVFAGAVISAPDVPASRLRMRGLRAAYRQALELAGARRLLVSMQVLPEGRRLPLIAAVSAARALGIPAETTAGEQLTARDVARRRL